MSNISGDGESFYSGNKGGDDPIKHYSASTKTNSDRSSIQQQQAPKDKKKRNPPGNPGDRASSTHCDSSGKRKHKSGPNPMNAVAAYYPDAEVIALSPKTLMATNRFVCEICHKGFQRDQNLQLHRRGHNLPWKLRQRTSAETRKRVYVCPETYCVHHNPARALGDLTGIKKHYSRKHGEKKWKCDKCSKKYAVQADCKAHSRTCGTREYKCLCGTIFSRKDSFITHSAFCDALAEEKSKVNHVLAANLGCTNQQGQVLETMSTRISENKFSTSMLAPDFSHMDVTIPMKTFPDDHEPMQMPVKAMDVAGLSVFSSSLFGSPRSLTSPTSRLQLSKNSSTGFSGYNDSNSKGQQEAPNFSATALLQKAAQIGANMSSSTSPAMGGRGSTPNAAPFSHNAMLKHLTDIQTYGILSSYMNMVEQRRMQETSASDRFHDTGSNRDENSRMSSLGTYNCLFDQNLEFLNNIYGPYSTNDDTIMKGRNQAGIDAPKGHTSARLRKSEGSCGSNDSNFMTLDLLGTGGFGHAVFDGMQQQEMDFEAAKAVEDANFGCVSEAYDSRNN